MVLKRSKLLLAGTFTLFVLFFSNISRAEEHTPGENAEGEATEEKFNASEVIFHHILDAHEFHFLGWKGSDGEKHELAIPLPVWVYSAERGMSFFNYSKLHEGAEYEGYKADHEGKIIAVKADGTIDESVKLYDFSPTRNVIQMLLALGLLVWIMTSIAGKYKKGQGVTSAPKGMQGLFEPIITFVRDEVSVPNLGRQSDKYLPYLLTVFFFILINNIFGLIPGTANVTGNIAFTVVLGVISFVVIMASSNGHYWGHIFNPPGVPGWVKVILVPVEILGVFTKPFALIIRLFANMVAGHIIIICLISLIFIFAEISQGVAWGVSPLSIGFSIFIYFIEVLVAFLQAFIFTMLTAVFIGQAMEGAHHDEAEAHL